MQPHFGFASSLCFLSCGSHGTGLFKGILKGGRLGGLTRSGQDHGLGPEGRRFELHTHAGSHDGLEGAHGVAGGAGAAADGHLSAGCRRKRRAMDLAE